MRTPGWIAGALAGASGVAASLVFAALGNAAEPVATSTLLPVSIAKDGFSLEESVKLREGWTWRNAYDTGDRNLYAFLHWEEFVPHAVIRRSGAVRTLASAPVELGAVTARTSIGELSLDAWLADPRSRVQGFIVMKRGAVVYERYPGMRAVDHHIWNSIAKTVASLAVGLLEADGRIDVSQPIEKYLPELVPTQWKGIRVIDILDMASGMDVAENDTARFDSNYAFGRFWRYELGDTQGLPPGEQTLFNVKRLKEPGTVFEYSSMDTRLLGILAERISGQRLAEFFSARVWSKLGAEGDGLIGVTPQGGAAVYGMVSTRLRDLARYGLLFTPSWNAVAGEQVVPSSYIEKVQKGCRPALLAASGRSQSDVPQEDRPVCNSRQWDAVYVDGDFYKGGARGQGLYISPSRDVVVAWYSTTMEGGWERYARAIAKQLAASSGAASEARSTTGASTADDAAIRELVMDYVAARKAGDKDKVRKLYADDAMYFQRSGQEARGNAAVVDLLFAPVSTPSAAGKSEIVIDGTQAAGELGYVYGRVCNRAEAKALTCGTRWFLVTRKGADGAWRVQADIDTATR